jgi:hypothetical protein
VALSLLRPPRAGERAGRGAYWKAYAEHKLAESAWRSIRRAELRKTFPASRWL